MQTPDTGNLAGTQAGFCPCQGACAPRRQSDPGTWEGAAGGKRSTAAGQHGTNINREEMRWLWRKEVSTRVGGFACWKRTHQSGRDHHAPHYTAPHRTAPQAAAMSERMRDVRAHALVSQPRVRAI